MGKKTNPWFRVVEGYYDQESKKFTITHQEPWMSETAARVHLQKVGGVVGPWRVRLQYQDQHGNAVTLKD